MTRSIRWFGILAISIVLVCAGMAICRLGHSGDANKSEEGKSPRLPNDANPSSSVTRASQDVDIELDEKSAVRIAEIILASVYGDEVLDQRPWNVSSTREVFEIQGMLKTTKGGVATIQLKKTNCQVVQIYHTK